MSMANSRELVGKVALVEQVPFQQATFGGFLGVLRSAQVEPHYLMAFLRSDHARSTLIDGASQTTNIANISLGKLRPLLFPLPPLAEQARIVARVGELMRLCDALEAKGRLEAEQHARLLGALLGTLTNSATPEELAANWQRAAAHFDLLLDRPEAVDALEQTILQLAVRGLLLPQAMANADVEFAVRAGDERLFELPQGWKWLQIEDVATVQGGIQKTPARRPVHHHVPYLRVANVQRDRLDLREIERFEVTVDEADRWSLRAGDLLIVEGNGSEHEIGRSAVWSGAIETCVYQNHLIRVRCNDPALVSFLQLFLNSPDGKAEMKRLAITTSGLYNLSVGKIRRFFVPLPPSEEQARIVTRVTELRRLCNTLRQRLAAQQTVQSQLADALVEQALA